MSDSWERPIAAAIVLGVAVVVAVGLRLLTSRLGKRAGDTRWAWDDLFAKLVHDLAVPITVIAGIWISLKVWDAPRGTLDVLARLLTAAAIFFVSVASARLIAGSLSSYALARQGVAANVTIFANIAKVLVIGIGMLIMLQSLGVSIGPLLGALGVGGLAVALALQDTLANLFAGVHILAAKTIEPGHYIRLDTGQEGYVVDINWRNTTIRTLSDNIEVIPNQKFSDTILTNYSRPGEEMSILVYAKLPYEIDLDEAEGMLEQVGHEVMKEVQGGVEGSGVFVRFDDFNDSSVGFHVILRSTEFEDQFRIKHEYLKRLHRVMREEGYAAPYWHHRVSLQDAPVRNGNGAGGNGAANGKGELPA
ncbi:mechanosensitive ion channel family protein [Actinomadura algeriensis]|uniref:Small-conductance mechanosensitive channel n=1 Tax=Actinomadura algeriensis TaxID=1679523 RepID=A0ABR9K436_9ACTN|nr:mechanosensitive ion channel family protein [Actinomadura algeriensis]MBE1537374.1 small-conductance mechanosensitive channel [Actinomadura algeriensis]